MVNLYIENKLIELDKEVQFAITKTFEDITNPTSIINDWSKTVSIPFTDTNNEIFGHIYNPDRLTLHTSDESLTTGLYFDPLKKLDFRLEWDSMLLMQGYAKMTSITKSNGKGRYNVTLNGELGKIFQEMKKITFDSTVYSGEDKDKYWIDGSKYVDEIIDKDLIYRLWNNEPNLENLNLVENTDSTYSIADYIGFIPNNSYDDNFDYKTFQLNNQNSSKTFAEVLDEKAKTVGNQKDDDNDGTVDNDDDNYQTVVGIAADTVIGEGLLPREIGEYRSYLQIPYIYFNKLFQIFMKKTQEITEYNTELDGSWFNYTNPYWSRLVYILSKLNRRKEGKIYKSTLNSTFGNFTLTDSTNHYYSPRLSNTKTITWSSIINNTNFLNTVRNDFIQNKFNNITFSQTIPIKLSLKNVYNDSTLATENYITLANGYHININFRVKDANGNVVFTNIPICLHNPNSTNFEGFGVEIDGIPKKTTGEYEITFDIPFNMVIERGVVGDNFDIEVAVYSSDIYNRPEDTIFYLINNLSGDSIYRTYPETITVTPFETEISVTTSNNKQSFSKFDLNELWNNEFNPFNEILNYCKQYRIGIFCDDINKKLIFKPLSNYFSDYKVLDWTDKLDISKEYHIQPITFENKYLLFNYEKNETELNKQYNERYGLNYGEYRLTTDYEFNTEEKEIFKYSKVTIPSTDICLSWDNLYDNLSILYTLPAEITAHNKDKDEKNVNVFGSMLFYKGLANFDTTSGMRSVSITDDTNFQMFNQTYFYTQNGQDDRYIKTQKYPILDIVANDNLCTFAIPSENFTYVPNAYDNKNGIYENFWKAYLNERYNTNNKIVTCYLDIKPIDYCNFEFNNFVKIDNQLYFVNKIYDYDITSNSPTKVDLITVQDLNGYTKNNYNFSLLEVFNQDKQPWNNQTDYIHIDGTGSETIYISSTSDVTFEFDHEVFPVLTINGERETGIIPAGTKIPVTFHNVETNGEGTVTFSNEDDKSIIIDVKTEINTKFTLYDSDKTVWSSTDKIYLENTGTLTKTLYITSQNADVSWNDDGTNLQDLTVNGVAGSGTIPKGTLVPVTLTMDIGDNESRDMPVYGKIKFYTPQKTVIIDVTLVWNEIFDIYRWDGERWNEDFDYIELTQSEPIKTIYLSANDDVEWSDVSGDLQNLYLSTDSDEEDWGGYKNGGGVIYPPSNMKPVHFRMDTSGQQGTDSGKVSFFNGKHEWFIDVVLRG